MPSSVRHRPPRGAANAVKGAADALTNMMNKATAKAEEQNQAETGQQNQAEKS